MKQKNVVICPKGSTTPLTEGRDYELEYKNIEKAGKAKLIIEGIGGYTGSITKTYTIKALDLSGIQLTYDKNVIATQNRKGAAPELNWSYNGCVLQKNIDYTVKYSNNKNITTENEKAVATVKGKGYFKGSIKCNFDITAKELTSDEITYTVEPVLYSAKKKIYTPKVTVYDNGVKLTQNKDYVIVYDTSEEAKITQKPVDEVIRTFRIVTTKNGDKLNGCYLGELEGTFKVSAMLINKMKGIVTSSVMYTGQPVELSKNDIQVSYKEKGKTITLSPKDFEIIGYYGNDRAGKDKVIIEGKGKYGGQKVITFKISVNKL